MPAGEMPFPPPSGALLAGKYTVVRVIGRGGMAHVLEARHDALDTNVAVKILHPDFRFEEEATSRFSREARAVAKLTSSHVARVLDVDTHEGCPFMVLELLRGADLGQELARRGPLPIHEAVSWVIQACEGMRDAHRVGVVHRDLKPSNLFLAETPAGRSVKILDFGISKIVSGDPHSKMTTTQSSFGTPLYMSPEQVRSVKHVDARTDIWSLGVILYEALTCRVPFEKATASAVFVSISVDTPRPIQDHRPDIPDGLTEVLARALEKQPEDRYPDVMSFATALAPFATAEGVLESSMRTLRQAAAVERRRRWQMALLFAACVAAGLASVLTASVLGKRASNASAETSPEIEPERTPSASAEATAQQTPPEPAPIVEPATGEPLPAAKSADAPSPAAKKGAGGPRTSTPRSAAPPTTSSPEAPPTSTSLPPPPPAAPDDPKYL